MTDDDKEQEKQPEGGNARQTPDPVLMLLGRAMIRAGYKHADLGLIQQGQKTIDRELKTQAAAQEKDGGGNPPTGGSASAR